MVTFSQLAKFCRIKKKKINRVPALQGSPQKKAVCVRVVIRTPKKPNSALRKLAWVKLSNHVSVFAYIPGEGHNLVKFGSVLIRGGRVKDLPGVKYKIIRGKFDLAAIKTRRQGRSKYGAKQWKQ